MLSRKRMFTAKTANPADLVGSTLHLPNLKRYLAVVHSHGGWGSSGSDLQTTADFRFNGKSLSVYAKKVLGKDLKKLYVPMAFTGVLATALQSAGHEVYASDLSEFWVSNLKRQGLRAELRSFEDIPSESFDAIVCFEPYPVSCNLVGYLGVLRSLSRSIPFIEISAVPHFGCIPPETAHLASPDPIKVRLLVRGKCVPNHPRKEESMERQAYDYGIRWTKHLVYFDEKYYFDFTSSVPTPASIKRISLDLMLLERQDEWASTRVVSIRLLAHSFGKLSEEIAASLLRLREISKRFSFDAGWLFYAGVSRNAAKEDPSVILRIKLVE